MRRKRRRGGVENQASKRVYGYKTKTEKSENRIGKKSPRKDVDVVCEKVDDDDGNDDDGDDDDDGEKVVSASSDDKFKAFGKAKILRT